ncbi:MAG TPA: hypothetical protein VGT61_13535 [Thermomicrobiales bacterium]|jgi:hypothetical protein|nr:hypothetical protein [Thermomicrobiales bacterium]
MVEGRVPVGTRVLALDGEVLGTVRTAYRNYLLVAITDSEDDLEVPSAALGRVEQGTLYLTVNRSALTLSRDGKTYERLHGNQ